MAGRFRIGPEDFVYGRVLQDRYDKGPPAFIHSLNDKSNLDPDQFFPGFFHSLKNEGRRTLSYLTRNNMRTLFIYSFYFILGLRLITLFYFWHTRNQFQNLFFEFQNQFYSI
jgi:hypothetical protein